MGVEKASFHTLMNPEYRGKTQQVCTNMVSSSDLSYSKLGVLKVEHTNQFLWVDPLISGRPLSIPSCVGENASLLSQA